MSIITFLQSSRHLFYNLTEGLSPLLNLSSVVDTFSTILLRGYVHHYISPE